MSVSTLAVPLPHEDSVYARSKLWEDVQSNFREADFPSQSNEAFRSAVHHPHNSQPVARDPGLGDPFSGGFRTKWDAVPFRVPRNPVDKPAPNLNKDLPDVPHDADSASESGESKKSDGNSLSGSDNSYVELHSDEKVPHPDAPGGEWQSTHGFSKNGKGSTRIEKIVKGANGLLSGGKSSTKGKESGASMGETSKEG